MVVANNVAIFGLLLVFVLGGFIIAKGAPLPLVIILTCTKIWKSFLLASSCINSFSNYLLLYGFV